MTPDEFKAARQALGYSQARMAEALGVHLRTAWRWERGERAIPEPVARLIDRMLEDIGA